MKSRHSKQNDRLYVLHRLKQQKYYRELGLQRCPLFVPSKLTYHLELIREGHNKYSSVYMITCFSERIHLDSSTWQQWQNLMQQKFQGE